jgi:hypothetical protein
VPAVAALVVVTIAVAPAVEALVVIVVARTVVTGLSRTLCPVVGTELSDLRVSEALGTLGGPDDPAIAIVVP